MIRLSLEDEKKIISDEENAANIENLKEILPYFHIEEETKERLVEILDGRNEKIDLFFELNNQRRAFYKVDDLSGKDQAFKYFSTCLENNYDNIVKWSDRLIAKKIYGKNEVFKNGYFEHGKQRVKLFKWCLKSGLMSKDELDLLNTKRTAKSKITLCISRNPIDFLMCSTGSNFSSCISLESGYDAGYYMCLPSLVTDTSRIIIMAIDTTKKRTYNIKGKNFSYIPVLARSWGYLNTRSKRVFVDKPYPTAIYNLKKLVSDKYQTNKKSFVGSPFPIPRSTGFIGRKKEEKYIPYLDYIGLEVLGDGMCRYNTKNGGGGQFNFNISRFSDVTDDILSLQYNEGGVCDGCGKNFLSWSMEYIHRSGNFCPACAEEKTFICEHCGDRHSVENLIKHENTKYCPTCHSHLFTKCCVCGEILAYTEMRDVTICNKCFNEHYSGCTKCGRIRPNDEITDGLCRECRGLYSAT